MRGHDQMATSTVFFLIIIFIILFIQCRKIEKYQQEKNQNKETFIERNEP